MNNNRAEPTTEFVEKKRSYDIQPFSDEADEIWVSHNGIIANDKNIIKKYNLKAKTKIDTAFIPLLLKKKWNGSIESLRLILMNKIVGSYSFVIYNKKHPNKVFLATNFKPLYLLYDFTQNTLYFSSLNKYLQKEDYNSIFTPENLLELKPYTLCEVNLENKKIISKSLYPELKGKKKAIILASGGMDSTVCASWAKKQNYEILLLHFDYLCKAKKKEIEAIINISKFLKCKYKIVNVSHFKKYMHKSALIDKNCEINTSNLGIDGAEFAHEYVNARNLIFLSLAAGLAEAWKYDYIILGGNLEESGAYADNEYIFQKKFDELLPNALNLNSKVKLLMPIANLMKHEIVKLGVKLNSPLHLTWSCYKSEKYPCQQCGPDYMRRVAFKINNLVDMQDKVSCLDYWKNCRKLKLKNNKWIKCKKK
jgi:7-cyano-7-deazaguanine synthase